MCAQNRSAFKTHPLHIAATSQSAFCHESFTKVLNLEEHPESCAQTGLKLLWQVSVYGACRIVENASPKEVSNHIEAICAVAQLREELVLRSTCFPSRQQTCMNMDSLTGP